MWDLSIATGIAEFSRDRKGIIDIKEALTRLMAAGYRCFDLGFTAIGQENFMLNGDDWEKRIDELAEFADRNHIRFGQSHLPFAKLSSEDLDPRFKKPGFREFYDERTRRAVIASARLGIPYTVAHPLTDMSLLNKDKKHLEKNRRYYDPYVELGLKLGVAVTFENMRPDTVYWRVPYRYCQFAEQLMEYVDSYQDPRIGICWDTGHANHAKHDQPAAIREIGDRLHVLHLNDNHYNARDEHFLPFMGELDWHAIMKALADIRYEGTLNYEIGAPVKTVPYDLQPAFYEVAYKNGVMMRQILKDFSEKEQEVTL